MPQEKGSLPCAAEWVEGIIANGIFFSHPIEHFTSLRYIQLTSAGFDRVPMEYIKEHGISIFNAKGVYSTPMAEFALNGVLALYKQNRFFGENQKKHKWLKHRGIQELYGKHVCIVGCGNIGTECAKRFGAFGCRIVGVDVRPYASDHYARIFPLEALDGVLKTADVVVLTVPLTEQTRHLMGAERFLKFKPGSVFVNIARGAVVDTQALTDALREGWISAVLDVFEEEPLNGNSPLWDMENVLITPHNCFVGDGNHERLWRVISENLKENHEDIDDTAKL